MKVDSREPKYIVRWFKKKGWNVTYAKFGKAGDIADDNLKAIFERKHGSDVVASVYDGRLIKQCSKLFIMCEDNDALGYVVISGDLIESIDKYENHIRLALQKKKKTRIPKSKFSLNINAAQIYKTISLLPWKYDVNVLWFLSEEEALETIHYMLQEVTISDPFTETLNKRRKSKSKTRKKKVVPSRPASRDMGRRGITIPTPVGKDGGNETTKEKYKRLGLMR